MRNKGKDDAEWIDSRGKHVYLRGLDERMLIRFYRLCKDHYEFFLGVFLTVIVVVFIIK